MKTIRIVAVKELREMIRDRRVLFGAFIMPIILIMLFAQLIGTVERSFSEQQSIKLAILGDASDAFFQGLQGEERIQFIHVESIEVAQKQVEEGEVELALRADHEPDGRLRLEAHYTSERPRSMVAYGAIKQAAEEAKSKRLGALAKEQGLSEAEMEPVLVEGEDLGKQEGLAGSPLSGLLPYLIILWTFYGGMSLVSDLIAGEKEKGTLETLLVSPIRRRDAALGKLIALTGVCLLSGLSSLVGLLLSQLFSGGSSELIQGGLQVAPMSVVVFVLVLVPLALMFAGIMTAVSALAKSTRESQTYLTVVSFLIITPAIMSQFIGITGDDKELWAILTPVLNSSLVLQEAIKGRFDWANVMIAAGGSLVLALMFSLASVKMFQREQILNRT